MTTFFESSKYMSQSELFSALYKVQTTSYGYLDMPKLKKRISELSPSKVLDIGTGDGSFLLELAEDQVETNFIGIDSNEQMIRYSNDLLTKSDVKNASFTHALFDSSFAKEEYDLILSRLTLQHISDLEGVATGMFNALRNGGTIYLIEPMYDYYECDPNIPIWREYRERLKATYELMGSEPNIPRKLPRLLYEIGFSEIVVDVGFYSPVTIGYDRFKSVVLATCALVGSVYPDIWEHDYLKRIENWLGNIRRGDGIDPYISISHITASKKGREVRL